MIDSSAFQGKKAAYYTLGCKLNFSETSTFGKMLEDMGVITAKKGEKADICLINTCSVTEVADHKCRQAIHRMVRNNPVAIARIEGAVVAIRTSATRNPPISVRTGESRVYRNLLNTEIRKLLPNPCSKIVVIHWTLNFEL
jgi:tRNA A37 methylthiotransferase MiaB